MAANQSKSQRRRIRFEPDPLSIALIDFGTESDSFSPSVSAIILDEAPMGGCGLVTKQFKNLSSDLCIRVKVGEMAPLHAVVRSVREIDYGLARIGVEFLE